MPYKTLMLQIYKPSRRKQILMDSALIRYSAALQFLLEHNRPKLMELSETEENITNRYLLNLIDKETAKSLNDFQIQPFKDSLKVEFASMAAAFIARKRNNARTGFPTVLPDSAAILPIRQDSFGLAQKNRVTLNFPLSYYPIIPILSISVDIP